MRSVILTKVLALGLAVAVSLPAVAKDDKNKKAAPEGFKFTDEVVVKTTSVKDQSRSGTCWSFAATGLLEAELLRMGKGEYDLSEMYFVRQNYHDKAETYVRFQGKVNFAGGGSFADVFSVLSKYGALPEDAYRGLEYGEDTHVHGELDDVSLAYVNAVLRSGNKRLSTAWLRGFDGILDAYLGVVPTQVTYKGASYNAKSFAEHLGIKVNDYVSFTSFNHHPFYEKFILEIPDNWRRNSDYNVPLEDMIAIIDNALKSGYTVGWGSDVSEPGFIYRKGFAVVPSETAEELSGSEELKWADMSASKKRARLEEINGPVPQAKVTQEMRQVAFDRQETTDDHGMLIVGIAKDQKGNKYYKVKNSWNASGVYGGYFYASEEFVKYKTLDIMVHRDAVPSSVAQKLGNGFTK